VGGGAPPPRAPPQGAPPPERVHDLLTRHERGKRDGRVRAPETPAGAESASTPAPPTAQPPVQPTEDRS
jgi:hypothetical protein